MQEKVKKMAKEKRKQNNFADVSLSTTYIES